MEEKIVDEKVHFSVSDVPFVCILKPAQMMKVIGMEKNMGPEVPINILSVIIIKINKQTKNPAGGL